MVEILGLSIPILALLIPIVVILTTHQRKMAEIIHKGGDQLPGALAEIHSLRMEVRELRERINQQTIALDGFISSSSIQRSGTPQG